MPLTFHHLAVQVRDLEGWEHSCSPRDPEGNRLGLSPHPDEAP